MEQTCKGGSDAPDNGGEGGNPHFFVSNEHFDFKKVEVDDPKITGAQIAESVGAHPVTDYVVMRHLKNGELQTLRPTELVHLKEGKPCWFFVIKGSEIYRFVVGELSMEWPCGTILGKHIKLLARADIDDVLVFDRPEGERIIENEEYVDLRQEGVEKLRIRKKPKLIRVIYNHDREYFLEPRIYTTQELFAKFGVANGYLLDLVNDSGLHELVPDEKVLIVEGMEFASHPPRGRSS